MNLVIRKNIGLFALLFLTVTSARGLYAFEIYSFVDKDMKPHQGFLIDAGERDISLLLMGGTVERINREDIRSIILYNIIENPVPLLNMKGITGYLKRIRIENSREGAFTGFPIQFMDGLVFLYDTEGNIHLTELTRIVKLDDYRNGSGGEVKKNPHVPIVLDDGNRGKGKTEKRIGERVYPTKIIHDRIRILEFFSRAEKGFLNFNNYQERTRFYAKPYLFDRAALMGNYLIFRKDEYKRDLLVNPYLKFSYGKPYGVQSSFTAGDYPCPLVPSLFPVRALQSYVKTHFFNSTFIGNLDYRALSAGSRYFTDEEDVKDATAREKLIIAEDPYVTGNINYMLLMGVDYRYFSLSTGFYYPVNALRVNNHFREVLAAKKFPPREAGLFRGGPGCLRRLFTEPVLRFRRYREGPEGEVSRCIQPGICFCI